MKFIIHPLQLSKANWEDYFNKSLLERENYALDAAAFSYTQVAGTILGAPLDHYSYKEFLYELAYDTDEVHLLTTGTLEKQIDNKHFQSIQRIMNIHKDNNGLSVNRFVAFMEGESLLPLRGVSDYYVHLRSTYMSLLQTISDQHSGLLHPDFQRLLTDTIKWSWNHLEKWMKAIDYTKQVIKIVWYGDATKSETYFLYFLWMLGMDVLVFHPEGKNIFSILKGIEIPSFSYPSTFELEPFPTSKPRRKATVAEKASVELDQILHVDGSYLFKAWQFKAYSPQSVTLHSTYDEVRLITREKAFVRPSFEVKNKTVYIPVIFAKICGIAKDRRVYAQKYRDLVEADLTVVYHTFPFTKEVKGNHQYHFEHATTNGVLEPRKMMAANWWKYRHLPEGLQMGLATAISRYVDKANLKPKQGEDVRHYLFSQAMEMPSHIIQLLQRFDYSQDVPKIVLFNNGKSGEISRSDAARLLLLNEFGVDIVLFNPTGQNDIELHLDMRVFDDHWLEDISFDESHQAQLSAAKDGFKPEMIVKNLFNKLISKRG